MTYVEVFESSGFGGAYMYISDDYAALATIGWNDRISSFKAQNYETGAFYTDWFYGGNVDGFCCNAQVSSLGTFNDTFSAVRRT